MRTVLFALLCGVAVGGLLGLANLMLRGSNAASDRVFSPVEEQTRRQTFEQSKAFRDGMVHDLQDMQIQWINASDANKPAIAYIIKDRAAGIDPAALPHGLRNFIASL